MRGQQEEDDGGDEEDAEENEDEDEEQHLVDDEDEEEAAARRARRRRRAAKRRTQGRKDKTPAPLKLPWFGHLIGFTLVSQGRALTGGRAACCLAGAGLDSVRGCAHCLRRALRSCRTEV